MAGSSDTPGASLTFAQLSFAYTPDQPVLNNICLDVRAGETLVLLGESGSGKSTLLKMANRLLDPTQGEVRLNQKPITQKDPVLLRRSIGYVIQDVGLFEHWTVRKNIEITARLAQLPVDTGASLARSLLSSVELNPDVYLNKYPDELSGGQAQRVGVARALATHPSLMLMDEPFGALDAITRRQMQALIRHLKQQSPFTLLLVTHDILEACALADRIAILNAGVIEQVGAPREIINQPASDYVRSLVQQSVNHIQNLITT